MSRDAFDDWIREMKASDMLPRPPITMKGISGRFEHTIKFQPPPSNVRYIITPLCGHTFMATGLDWRFNVEHDGAVTFASMTFAIGRFTLTTTTCPVCHLPRPIGLYLR